MKKTIILMIILLLMMSMMSCDLIHTYRIEIWCYYILDIKYTNDFQNSSFELSHIVCPWIYEFQAYDTSNIHLSATWIDYNPLDNNQIRPEIIVVIYNEYDNPIETYTGNGIVEF